MMTSLLSIKISVHVIDNSNDEIRGYRVKRDVGRDEEQLIKFAWPNKNFKVEVQCSQFS